MINRNYHEIRQDVQSFTDSERERILEAPAFANLINQKNQIQILVIWV